MEICTLAFVKSESRPQKPSYLLKLPKATHDKVEAPQALTPQFADHHPSSNTDEHTASHRTFQRATAQASTPSGSASPGTSFSCADSPHRSRLSPPQSLRNPQARRSLHATPRLCMLSFVRFEHFNCRT